VFSRIVEIRTYGPMELHPITKIVEEVVAESCIGNGVVWISVEGATPALLILNTKKKEFIKYITSIIPFKGWRHGNAYAHLISTLISTNLVLPVMEQKILLNPDEEIYLLETRSVYNHVRNVFIEVHGY